MKFDIVEGVSKLAFVKLVSHCLDNGYDLAGRAFIRPPEIAGGTFIYCQPVILNDCEWEYRLLTGISSELEKEVGFFMKKGWKLHGITAMDSGGIIHSQAVKRRAVNNDSEE